MTISIQSDAASRRPARRSLKLVAAAAMVCAVLAGCTGEQFQKGYILPPGALEQIPIGARDRKSVV